MMEKEVEMSSTGELNFKIPQQEWTGNDAIQSSYFAGQEMFIKRSDEQSNDFELHYLGLNVSRFADMGDAKFNALEFARSVFQILSDLMHVLRGPVQFTAQLRHSKLYD